MKKTRSGEPLETVTTSSRNYPAEDELYEYLRMHYSNYWVSGTSHYGLPIINNGAEGNKIKNICILTIGDSISKSNDELIILSKIADKLSSGEKSSYEKLVVIYPEKQKWNDSVESLKTVNFKIYNEGHIIETVSGTELKKRIYDSINLPEAKRQKMKTYKRVQDHVSNYFQFWVRNFLSPDIKVSDIDGALFYKEQIIPVEIKRSAEDDWKPYFEDAWQYENYARHAKKLNSCGAFLVLHHDGEWEHEEIASKDGKKCKHYRYYITDKNTIVKGYFVRGVDVNEIYRIRTKYKKAKKGNYLVRRYRKNAYGKLIPIYHEGQEFTIEKIMDVIISWLKSYF